MTRQELVDKCTSKIKTIESILDEDDSEEFEFYQNLFDSVNYKNASDYASIGLADLFLAHYNAITDYRDFETNRTSLSSLMEVIENGDSKDLMNLNDYMLKVVDNEFMSNTIKKIAMGNNRDFSFLEKRMLKKGFKHFHIEDTDNIIELIELYIFDSEKIIKSINFILSLRFCVEDSKIIDNEIDDYFFDTKLRKKEFDKIHSKMAKQTEASSDVLREINVIRSYKNSLFDEKNRKQKKLLRDKQNYKAFLDKINFEFKRDEIVNYEELIKKIHDEEIRLSFLKMVYQHNLAKYKEVEQDFNEVNENSYLKYMSLLKEYDISKEEINFTQLTRQSCELTKVMLDTLKQMGLSKPIIIKSLEKGNMQLLIYVKSLKDKGILSNTSIEKYSDILVEGSDAINSLTNNLSIFENLNINPANLINNPEVLINNDYLETNIMILEKYKLIDSIKSKSNYNYLADSNLVSKIDKFLELGYENFLIEDLSLLNEDNIERLYVLKGIDYPINTREELLEVLKTDSFFIPDDKVKNYISDASFYYMNDDISISLVDCPCTTRVCDVDGVYLSLNRIKRNEENGLKGLQALIKDGLLSIEEIETLKNRHSSKII